MRDVYLLHRPLDIRGILSDEMQGESRDRVLLSKPEKDHLFVCRGLVYRRSI